MPARSTAPLADASDTHEGAAATVPAPEDNPVRGPLNSWFFSALNGYLERRFAAMRDDVAAEVAGASDVVEIGPGNGPLFARLRAGTRVHAVEPNRHFHQRLRASADRAGIDLVLHDRTAESIDLPDDSVDAVISTWVLCTVKDPHRVLEEIVRVLRPGGRFAFYEHVAATQGSAIRSVQDLVHQPWAWIFEGCQTDRDTAARIRAAGFTSVDLRDVHVRTMFVPIRTQIAGVATA